MTVIDVDRCSVDISLLRMYVLFLSLDVSSTTFSHPIIKLDMPWIRQCHSLGKSFWTLSSFNLIVSPLAYGDPLHYFR